MGEQSEQSACANCGAPLAGAYCHACGQKAQLHHRISHLAQEAVEGIAHLDGRLWRTLPLLAFNPGRLSREWLAGRRVRFVPPLHVFLFAMFLLFLLPMFTGRHLVVFQSAVTGDAPASDSAARPMRPSQATEGSRPAAEDTTVRRLVEQVAQKAKNARYYSYKIETLAYKLAIFLAPISMAILAIVTLGQGRTWTAYDHAVVSLYGLGFAALLLCVVNLAPEAATRPLAFVVAGIVPVHAVAHFKGAYGLSWRSAVLRAIALGALSLIAFLLFALGVTLLGLFG